MRCYTANEEAHVGIQPEVRDGKTGIHFPDSSGGGLVLPMNQRWLDRLYALDQQVLDKKLLAEGCILGLPLIVSAELSAEGDELEGRPVEQQKTQAMVLVEPPYNEKRVIYTAVAFGEIPEDGRVGRQYRPIEEAVGIEILLRHENRLLLIMSSGAMFRIQYVADDGSTRSLLFQWRDYAKPRPEFVLVNQQRKSRAGAQAMLQSLEAH